MRGKPERARVEVKESSAGDLRTFSITLTAPDNDFQLSDILKQRGVVGGLETELKQAVKGALDGYLKGAEELISGLVTKPASTQKSLLKPSRHNKVLTATGGGALPRSDSDS